MRAGYSRKQGGKAGNPAGASVPHRLALRLSGDSIGSALNDMTTQERSAMTNIVNLIDRSEMLDALHGQLRLRAQGTAVLAVDVHRGHLDPSVATMPVEPERVAAVTNGLSRLFEVSRAAAVPVIYITMTHRRIPWPGAESMANPFWRAVEDANQMLAVGGKSTIQGHNLEGSEQVGFTDELRPKDGDYRIDNKKRLSAFFGTDLDLLLRMLKVETTIIVGINTNTCVLCTAFEAFNRDYRVVVVKDCVDSMYGADLHAMGLQNIGRCLGWVVGLEEVEEAFSVEQNFSASAR